MERYTFTNADIDKHKEAWSQTGALTAMLNGYRAAVRYQARITNDMRVKVPAPMVWGMKDLALSQRMALPSRDYCDDGILLFSPEATHWVQHEEADEVNRHLRESIFTQLDVHPRAARKLRRLLIWPPRFPDYL